MATTNWVYTLIRILEDLGGTGHVDEIARHPLISAEQNPQKDLGATIRGSIHDYCSDHSSGKRFGARSGNKRDVFEKVGRATWRIRNHQNPFVKIALREVDDIDQLVADVRKSSDIASVKKLLDDLSVEKTVHVEEHWRRAPRRVEPSGVLFHLLEHAPFPIAPFSHAVEADGWVFLTGQMPTDPAAPDASLPRGITAQAERVMDNLRLVLGEIGLDLSHVVQARCFLTEFERDYAAFNDVWRAAFPPDRLPARTTVGVTALAVGALVEVDLIARRP